MQEKCRQINLEAYSKFQVALGTEPLSEGAGWIGQMVSHPLPTDIPEDLKKILLDDHKIEIPIFEWKGLNLIRISIEIYNTKKDVESLMSALASLN